MGLLEDYAIDLNDVDEPSYDIDDNFYEFVVGDMFVREGTANKPDESWIIIDFSLGDEGKSKQAWYGLPMDSDNPTAKEIQKLGFLKILLRDLGATDEQLADIDPDDFIGKSGTLEVFTKNGYQNIKNVKLDDASAPAEEEPAEEPAEEKAAKPARKAAAPKVAAAREAAAPAKAAAAGVKKNPFAK